MRLAVQDTEWELPLRLEGEEQRHTRMESGVVPSGHQATQVRWLLMDGRLGWVAAAWAGMQDLVCTPAEPGGVL